MRARGCRQRPRHAALALLLVFGLTPALVRAQAQWVPNGLPVCVIPGCSGRVPLICGDGAGGAVIAWNRNPTLMDENIYVHRVLNGGALDPVWPPKGTPATRAPGDQYLSDLVPDGAGGAFIVWYDFPNYDIYAQHVLGDGTIAPGWPADGLPVCTVNGQQAYPRLLPDDAGGVFVVWGDERVSHAEADIYGLHLNAGGTRVPGWLENGLAICTAPSAQGDPYLAGDGKGGFIAAWIDDRNGLYSIYAQRMDTAGAIAAGWPVNGRQVVGVDAGGAVGGVVADGNGGAYIGWQYLRKLESYGSDADIFATRVLANGDVAPGWPAAGYPVCTMPEAQFLSSVTTDESGGLLLAWYDVRAYPGVAYAERLRPDGTLAPGWQPNGNRVSDLPGYHAVPRAAPDGHGGVYVAFQEAFNGTGHIQRLTAAGAHALGWPSVGLPLVSDPNADRQDEIQITPDGLGGAIVVWNDARNGRQEQIYAQRYFGDGPTPVLVSLVSAEALPDRVTLSWLDPSRTLAGATIQRRRAGEEWGALGHASFDGAGRLSFEDRDVVPGARYAYRLGWLESGVEHFSAETWVDVPVALTLALEGARPNPAVGPLSVAFTLPRAEPAVLDLLDVSGRQVIEREVGSLGPGSHVIRLGECGCTPPGMYWLRLAQAGRSLVKRVAVVR